MKGYLCCFFTSIFFIINGLENSEQKPFVVGKLFGQLGNQLFQIAATVSLALDNDAESCFPDMLTAQDWGVPANYTNLYLPFKLNAHLKGNIGVHYTEPQFAYSPIPYYPNMIIHGYFQSEKYFAHHKNEIVNLFAPPQEVKDYLFFKYPEVLEHPKTVSIHLRNYQRPIREHPLHITYGRDYFEKAMALFPEDSLFVVCSNQIEWAKEELADIPRNLLFIENNPYHIDFYLMSLCKHNIICNSSFSWWAAYLNRNPEKIIIVPPLWFDPNLCSHNTDDLIPEGWKILNRIEEGL